MEAAGAAAAPRRRGLARHEALRGYILISPWIIGLVVFAAGPILASFGIAMTDFDGVDFRAAKWAGLGNYLKLLGDPLFWQSLKVTAVYAAFAIPLGLVVALLLAMLLNQKLRAISLFRTVFYLPSVTSGVAVALLWAWLFNPTFGVVNWVLGLVGVEGPGWLSSSDWALPTLILLSAWGAGGNMVIYLAGLQGIPQELYEAAVVDGANWWDKFANITVPMLSPTTFFLIVMGIIGSFQSFTAAFVVTDGGPSNATLFYALYLYMNAFRFYHMAYATAMAWVMFVIIFALTVVQFKLAPRWVYYE